MQSVTKLRLFASPEERQMLFSTMERCNAACNAVSPVAFYEKQFSDIGLQKRMYYAVRATFGLSAQMAQLAIRKVAGSYRSTIEAIREMNKFLASQGEPLKELGVLSFKDHGGICYDSRVLSIGRDRVSIWTLAGRIKLRYAKPAYFPPVEVVKQTDLVYRHCAFWLYVTIEIPDRRVDEPQKFLGVDLGIVNIATTSDGTTYSGEATEKVRRRYSSLRARLQRAGTKDAKEKLRQISGRENRFKTNTNHIISNDVVIAAQGTQRGIALEDLTGILQRTTVRHEQRKRHHKWAFFQLRSLIAYKAKKHGVLVKVIDGAYTSQQCSVCGHIDRGNRKSQAGFLCLACGHTENADLNAAKNIAARALVNEPIAVCSPHKGERLNRKPVKSMGHHTDLMPSTSVEGS